MTVVLRNVCLKFRAVRGRVGYAFREKNEKSGFFLCKFLTQFGLLKLELISWFCSFVSIVGVVVLYGSIHLGRL